MHIGCGLRRRRLAEFSQKLVEWILFSFVWKKCFELQSTHLITCLDLLDCTLSRNYSSAAVFCSSIRKTSSVQLRSRLGANIKRKFKKPRTWYHFPDSWTIISQSIFTFLFLFLFLWSWALSVVSMTIWWRQKKRRWSVCFAISSFCWHLEFF